MLSYVPFQDDLDKQQGSAGFLGLDRGLEELLLDMRRNVTSQVQAPV